MIDNFLCYVKVTRFDKNKIKNFTTGKKYLFGLDEKGYHKIMNDKKEWVDYYLENFDIEFYKKKCKFIKNHMHRKVGDIDNLILSHDKTKFLLWGKMYNIKENLKIL